VVREPPQHERVEMSATVTNTSAEPASEAGAEPAWYDGLAFSGPLDPAGTLFAFLLALVATVGVVVVVAAVVRMFSAG
jgi:hypothetical protein